MTPEQFLQQTVDQGSGVPTRPFGRTKEQVSIIGIGGWHIRAVEDDAEAIRIMHRAMDEGVNFFDNAWEYHNGAAEELMGKALAMDGRRQRVFLMSKNCERDYEGSKRCLEDSLRRLQTDHLDLWQFHECVYDNDPEWIWERGGLRAAIEAQQAGKVRYIGFTGHKDPRIHNKLLALPHEWDASMMPINVADAHFRSFEREVVPACVERHIAVIGMKGLGGGYPSAPLPTTGGLTVEDCYGYCLNVAVTTQVMGINSMAQLEQDLAVARRWREFSKERQEALRQRIRVEAGDGRFERFKSTDDFDGPHHRQQHGFAVA